MSPPLSTCRQSYNPTARRRDLTPAVPSAADRPVTNSAPGAISGEMGVLPEQMMRPRPDSRAPASNSSREPMGVNSDATATILPVVGAAGCARPRRLRGGLRPGGRVGSDDGGRGRPEGHPVHDPRGSEEAVGRGVGRGQRRRLEDEPTPREIGAVTNGRGRPAAARGGRPVVAPAAALPMMRSILAAQFMRRPLIRSV